MRISVASIKTINKSCADITLASLLQLFLLINSFVCVNQYIKYSYIFRLLGFDVYVCNTSTENSYTQKTISPTHETTYRFLCTKLFTVHLRVFYLRQAHTYTLSGYTVTTKTFTCVCHQMQQFECSSLYTKVFRFRIGIESVDY